MSKLETIYGKKISVVTYGLTIGEAKFFEVIIAVICNQYAEGHEGIINSTYNN
jgi:hypothetical protein